MGVSNHDEKSIYHRVPREISNIPAHPKNMLLIGNCLLNVWPGYFYVYGCECEHVGYNNIADLETPRRPITSYDLQIVAPPLRPLLPDHILLSIDYKDENGFLTLFEEKCDLLDVMLHQMMKFNIEHDIMTMVAGFLVPQQNPLGRAFPRFDLRNPVHFVERLNMHLSDKTVNNYKNASYFDIDQIASTIGKMYIYDDVEFPLGHNSILSQWGHDYDASRIEPQKAVGAHDTDKAFDFVVAIFQEVSAHFRTARQAGVVKMVVLDLDDTLWRGVIGETSFFDMTRAEGWPRGIIEALAYLRRRGVLLAIASKNEEKHIQQIWPYDHSLPLSAFTFVKINREDKVENIMAMIKSANILPSSVLFVDDNPVERASVEAQIPGVRTIGENPYNIRRVLLWSAETQVATISHESAGRGESIRQIEKREGERQIMTRETFLASLNLHLKFEELGSVEDQKFDRIFELLNKTNQFNTTGQRRSKQELMAFVGNMGRLFFFSVSDKFSDYGLVGILLVTANRIDQFVMSCRVAGLDVEIAVVAHLLKAYLPNEVSAVMKKTPANSMCRSIYERCGFICQDGELWISEIRPSIPDHCLIVV